MAPDELLRNPIAYLAPAKLLDGLTAEQAAARLPHQPHTIAEILAHLDYWQTWFLARCRGEAAPMAMSASVGWPAPDDWDALRERFVRGLDEAVALGAQGPERLEPPIEFPPLAEYTVQDALTHIAVHNAHHLGQIVVLRQLAGLWPPPAGSWTW